MVIERGMWHGEGGFRAKLKMGQVGICLSCCKSHIWKYSKMEKTILTGCLLEKALYLHGRITWKPLGWKVRSPKGEQLSARF